MAGLTECNRHGLQKNTFVSSELNKLIDEKEFKGEVVRINLLIEGIKINFYSDQKTAKSLNWKESKNPMVREETVEEFDAKDIIKVMCRKCVEEYIADSQKRIIDRDNPDS